jgi:hypothetical protein
MMSGPLRKTLAALICSSALVLVHASDAAAPPAQRTTTAPVRSPALPSPISTLAMVRSVLLAVDQANKTGNYTVLRDLGSPNFRNTNDAAKLAQVFAPLRSQGIDMLPVAVVVPAYKEPPRLTAQRMLYVAGQFQIAPRRVNFELLFEVVGREWRLYGVSIVPV